MRSGRWVVSWLLVLTATAVAVGRTAPAPALAVPGLAGTLEMTSEPGDFVGGGRSYTYSTLLADHFSAYGTAVYVEIGLNRNPLRPGPDIDYWQLRFVAPAGQRLEPGTYRAERDPTRPPDVAGLDVFGQARGCNLGVGTFTVDEVVRDPEQRVVLFSARFEQRCEPGAPALRGTVRVRAGRVELGDITI
jgi:hypothetical protein